MHRLNHLARVAILGAVVVLAACESKRDVLAPVAPNNDIFRSYVALGNSITAGYQSGGINDSTQRQSYARLLATSMNTQYHFASLAYPGCNPPIANGLTGARLGGFPDTLCAARNPASVNDVLNNVAVPGARVLDPTSLTTVASNGLTTLILGGKTQVQKALEAKPTFASIWIGNNDVLNAGLSGIIVQGTPYSPGIVSTQAQFQAAYDLMIKQLTDSAPGLKGVLIGVVQVSGVPSLTLGSIIAGSPALQGAINAGTGKTVVINPNCTGSAALVNLPQIILAIKAGTHPATIACVANSIPNTVVGDLFVLDPTEQATLSAAITAYNTYIQGVATAKGFAYYDPNPLFAAQRAAGAIPAAPNFASSTATFGPLFSLDAVHPSAAGQLLIANDLITVINAKYGTSLPAAH